MPTGSGDSLHPADGVAQVGGVRADFVANLGRRLSEVRRHWNLLERDPGSSRTRDEVRRRIHALAVRARIVGLSAMADRLDSAERRLEHAAGSGGIDDDDVVAFRALFDELPSLAWVETAASATSGAAKGQQLPAPPDAEPEQSFAPLPLAVLVLGDEALASALGPDARSDRMPAIEHERTSDLSVALDLARALAPDVVLLDADLPGALQFLERLTQDSLAGTVPVVAVGAWIASDQAAPFLTRGVTLALAKPVPPGSLRLALTDAAAIHGPAEWREEPFVGTVAEIAERIANQVRRGLVDALVGDSGNVQLQLGDGTEVLAATWGAVARIREILASHSDGAVRFSQQGPIGAVPLAPWLDQRTDAHTARRAGSGREAWDAPARLDARRVLVVDDDPAISWFFAGLFRTAGAVVAEARNGTQGLDQAIRFQPDLVVTDILMPELDGFALCRALKRDVALRDVPVVLLSWKEDLLQRVRELGADADGYLRKEASAAAILRNVHELLLPRIRLEERLRSPGQVRGRLDGWTALSLLRFVADTRNEALVSLRDAHFLYEVVVREGQVAGATRTAVDGSYRHGADALRSLCAATTGRFHVSPLTGPAHPPIDESMAGVIPALIARARAAQAILCGPRVQTVRRVQLLVDELHLASTPEPARTWFQAIADGIAPGVLLESQGVPAAALERALGDAAAHGAVESIVGDDHTDMLGPESAIFLARAERSGTVARGARVLPGRLSPPAQPALSAQPTAPLEQEPAPPPVDLSVESLLGHQPESRTPLRSTGPSFSSPPPAHLELGSHGEVPTSLAEAVIREVAEARDSLPPPSEPAPFLVDIGELRPRTRPPSPSLVASLPPDAIVPGIDAPDTDLQTSGEPSVPSAPSIPPSATPRSQTVVRAAESSSDQSNDAKSAPLAEAPDAETPTAPRDTLRSGPRIEPEQDSERGPQPTRDSTEGGAGRDSQAGEDRSPEPVRWWPGALVVLFVVTAVIVFAQFGSPLRGGTGADPARSGRSRDLVSRASAGPVGSSSPNLATTTTATRSPTIEPDIGLPPDIAVSEGMGLIEVRPGQEEAVVEIDGLEIGSGDVVRSVVPPGTHDVQIVWNQERYRVSTPVSASRRTRVSAEGLWAP